MYVIKRTSREVGTLRHVQIVVGGWGAGGGWGSVGVDNDNSDGDDDDICLPTASLCRAGQFRCGDGLCVDGSRCPHFNPIQSI